jgi:hypothetical protein
MGQYYKICNIDKQEYLNPHKFGQGLKFLEFATSGDGIMYGLATLLSDGMGRGGGDLRVEDNIIGSWAGDRIVVTGDYAGKRFIPEELGSKKIFLGVEMDAEDESENLYNYATHNYTDISDLVIKAIQKSDPHSRLNNIRFQQDGWRDARGIN